MKTQNVPAYTHSVSIITFLTFVLCCFSYHTSAQSKQINPNSMRGESALFARSKMAHKEATRQARERSRRQASATIQLDTIPQVEASAQASHQQARWQQANGPDTGYVLSLQAKGETVFAGTSGGIFVSRNAGRNWSYVEQGPDSYNFRINAVGNVLLAADGQARIASLWRSTNNGRSWEASDNGLPHGIGVYTIAASGSTAVAHTNEGKLYRSLDQGMNWEAVAFPQPIPFPNFASLGGTLLMGSNIGLFISNDNAATWQEAALNLPQGVVGNWPGVIGNRIFVGTTGAGVLISDDLGQTWHASNQGLPANSTVSGLDTIGSSIYARTETGDLYESLNRGASWELRHSEFSLNLGVGNFVSSGGVILAATSDGVMRSSDHGRTWRRSSTGLRAAESYDQETIGRHWFVTSWGGGFWRSSDQGKSWKQINEGIAPTRNQGLLGGLLLTDGRTLYAGTDTKLYRSNDLGETWTEIPDVIPEGNSTYFGRKLGDDLYIGLFGGVLVSKDHGKSFHLVEGLPADQPFDDFWKLGNILYACSYGGGMFRSDDGGEKWQAINDGLEKDGAQFVNGITSYNNSLFIGTDAATLYRSDNYGYYWYAVGIGDIAPSLGVNDVKLFGGKLYASTYGVGVLISSDGGLTWEKMNEGLIGKRLFNFKRVGDKIAINSSGHSVSLLPIWRE